MFNSLNNYLTELEATANNTKEFIRTLQGGRRRIINAIAKADSAIQARSFRNENFYAANIKKEIAKDSIKLAKQTLFEDTLNALKKTQEFDIPLYRRPLFEAIENNDTYFIRSTGSGFNSILHLDINLDKTAGRLNMWGTAIKAVRAKLKVKIPSKFTTKKKREASALQASRAWAGIYNKRGAGSKYDETIKARLSAAAKIAPFWELLDKGAVPLSSDRGGYPTPTNKPLNFVDKAEKKVDEQLKITFAAEREKYYQLLNNYDSVRDQAIEDLAQLSAIIEELKLDNSSLSKSRSKAAKALRAEYNTKLQKAVQLISEGLLTAKKLQLAIKGSYKGKRFSRETLEELL